MHFVAQTIRAAWHRSLHTLWPHKLGWSRRSHGVHWLPIRSRRIHSTVVITVHIWLLYSITLVGKTWRVGMRMRTLSREHGLSDRLRLFHSITILLLTMT